MIAEFRIVPANKTHQSRDVAKAVSILKEKGLPFRVGPMGTCVEGSWESVMDAIRQCHREIAKQNSRVITTISIDDQQESPHSLDQMVAKVHEELGERP